MPIRILDQQLINKIAAGEVVERPASAVKELVENSLDAGANSIQVEIEQGGIDLIKVTDNGCGMNVEDAKLCLYRHATSKISSIEDLMKLSTLGFRGEALAAISAVSQFRLVTRQNDALGAVEVLCHDNNVEIKTAAGSIGTSVEVRGLFYSVPARKKFLKSPATEFRCIAEIFTHQAMLTPQVAWKLVHNGKTVAEYAVVTDWKNRVESVWGKDLSAGMIEVKHQRGSLVIDGFLGHPGLARERSKQQFLFVNRRPVKDYLVMKAVKEGYHSYLSHGLQPSFAVQLSIAPDLVDVNVHPRKTEVKFADTHSVFREVVLAAKEALKNAAPQSGIAVFGQPRAVSDFTDSNSQKNNNIYPLYSSDRPSSTQIKQTYDFQQKIVQRAKGSVSRLPQTHSIQDWKLIGQTHKSFLLVESKDGLMIIDQHAVAEKILYEKLLQNLKAPKVQPLLIPLVFELSPQQQALVKEQAELFKWLGIEGEEFGGNSYRLTGLPQNLDVSDLKTFFFGVLDDMAEDAFEKIDSLEDRQKRLAKYAACRGAIKFNDVLENEEQLQLLVDMQRYNVTSCCHGRPVMMTLEIDDLKKRFQR